MHIPQLKMFLNIHSSTEACKLYLGEKSHSFLINRDKRGYIM
jgi:hypothetical protein